MKNLIILLCSLTALVLSNNAASAQASATANIGATIVVPTTAEKESDLEFGNVRFGNSNNRMGATANVEVVAKNVVRASIKVSGNPDYVYSVTIPSQVSVTGMAHPLTIGTQYCEESGSQTFSRQGSDSISIEGTITYGAAANTYAFNDDVPNGLPVIINNN